ncbi:MAG: hypothetical protein H0T71_12455 [Acidobacteria bacterium]|nr:hypothetical protein [Acidobacteriota bacterium]
MSLHSAIFSVVVALATGVSVTAQTPAPPLFRVFLHDGTALASFGEWARVDDRLIFSMPLAPGAGPGALHLVSLPVQRVDLPRTERYADTVRASHYAATRGEADFAQVSGTVADALNQIALIADPNKRLAAAEQARRSLTDWPGAAYGYRAGEVREIVGVLDDVIASLRASAGGGGFELALSASTVVPPTEPTLPSPNHSDVAQQLMSAASAVESPAEKVSLLQSVVALIDRGVDLMPASLAAMLRTTALGGIAEEQRTDSLYSLLRSSTLAEASRRAARADVRGLEQLRVKLRDEDETLGRKRPEDLAGVLATLDAHLDAAHRLRLAHDQWLLNEAGMRTYRRSAMPYIQGLIDVRASLDDIKVLGGPAPQRLRPLAQRLDRHARRLALLNPPSLLSPIHASFRSAYVLAERAVQLRLDAVTGADVELARQASAAAAGALMLLERARLELRAAFEPPLATRFVAQP